jgi:sialidase-1
MNKHIKIAFLIVLLFFQALTMAQSLSIDEKNDKWHSFERVKFKFQGREAWIVQPVHSLVGKPWIWRAYFPDWHIEIDSILLSRGFHLAYINANDMYGSTEAMQIWDSFYDFLVVQKRFAPKVALEGVSRGGLYIYNWAKRNPLKVSCMYAEAPVCDVKSWPGGKGEGKGSPEEWYGMLKSYHISEEQALAFNDNPIDNLEGLAACKVPVFHAIGLSDKIVPNNENTYKLINNYIRLGGIATVMPMTKGLQELEGHHFPIEQPERIADFILTNSYPVKKQLDPQLYHVSRSSLQNSYLQFTKGKTGRVAFMGGSITEGKGWRDIVCKYLTERFPDTKFEFINAGISSTGSTPGAFRLESEVLNNGKIDLFFEEAAVNDKTNGFDSKAQIRGMEGIIRHARISNPLMDIVLMHCVDPDKMTDYNSGKTPAEIVNHELVAAHYNINTIHLAKEVTERINANEFNWKQDFKDLHPSLFGHEVYAQTIKNYLFNAYKNISTEATIVPAILPKALDPFNYSGGIYLPIDKATSLQGWKLIENWKPNDGAGTRKQYVNMPALITEEPFSSMKLNFIGKAIGICIASGPDAGIIEYSIDGKPFKQKDLFTQWSKSLHLPWFIVLNDTLKNKHHTLIIRMLKEKNEKSKGNACRILHFLVNQY